jgi:hypothetical protein
MDIQKLINFTEDHVTAGAGDAIKRISIAVIPQTAADSLDVIVHGRISKSIYKRGTQTVFLKLGSDRDVINGSRPVYAWTGHPEWVRLAKAGDSDKADALLAAYVGATTLELAWQASGKGTRDSGRRFLESFREALAACGIVPTTASQNDRSYSGTVKAGARLKALLPEMKDDLATLRAAFPPHIAPESEPTPEPSEPKRVRVYCVADCDNNDGHWTVLTSHLSASQSSQTGIQCNVHKRMMTREIASE